MTIRSINIAFVFLLYRGTDNLLATFRSCLRVRLSKSSYKALNGNEMVIGDGLVPVESALLIGSKKIVIKETAHGKTFGKDWYGSKKKVEEWLNESWD